MLRLVACGLSLVLIAALGCTGGTPAPPKTVPTTLKVALADGEPLKAGEIRLVPERGSGGKEVEAVCRPAGDGTFKVTTFEDGDGAVPGKYVVVVKGVRGVPAKYGDSETSDLRATVASAGGTVEVRVAK
jgi:hypothetical protein